MPVNKVNRIFSGASEKKRYGSVPSPHPAYIISIV
jgi:hypothetical protein